MAPYVKSLDGNHVLGVGMEGFYSSQVSPNSVSSLSANPTTYAAQLGTDFVRNNQVRGIDYTSVHTYPDNWYDDHLHLTYLNSNYQTKLAIV